MNAHTIKADYAAGIMWSAKRIAGAMELVENAGGILCRYINNLAIIVHTQGRRLRDGAANNIHAEGCD